MITIEDRLRAAARAAADTVADDSARPLRLPPRGRHPGWLGWSHHRTLIVPLAAAAAVIALITASVFATHAVLPGPGRPAPRPPSAALPSLADDLPAYFLEYPMWYEVLPFTHFGTGNIGSSPGPAGHAKYETMRIVAAATGKAAATIKFPGYVTAIAASRGAFFAAVFTDSGARFYEIRRVRPGFSTMVLLPIRPVATEVAYLAVSPDGAKLACSTEPEHGRSPGVKDLFVVSTTGGSEHEWTTSASHVTGSLGPMYWLADNRTLAFNWTSAFNPASVTSLHLLDTAAPGSNFMAGRDVLPSVYRTRPFDGYTTLSQNGRVVVGLSNGSAASHAPQGSVMAFSTATGKRTILFRASPSGDQQSNCFNPPVWVSNAGSDVLVTCNQEVKATPPINDANTLLINHGHTTPLPWLATLQQVIAFP